jgi:hypothetical protein
VAAASVGKSRGVVWTHEMTTLTGSGAPPEPVLGALEVPRGHVGELQGREAGGGHAGGGRAHARLEGLQQVWREALGVDEREIAKQSPCR